MELRSDIATAASRMTSEYDVNREMHRLDAYLREGETVQRLATGMYGAGAGLLAVTNYRVLFLRDGRSGQASEGFPLGRLSSVDWSPDGTRATISVSDSNTTAVLRQVDSGEARGTVELIHQLVDGSSGSPRGVGHHGILEATARLHQPNGTGSYHGLGLGASTAPKTSTEAAPGTEFTERRPDYVGNSTVGNSTVGNSTVGKYGALGSNGSPDADGLGDGFLPGGRTLNGAGPPGSASLFDGNPSASELPDSSSATTMTFNRPVDSGPGWPVRGIPAPASPGDAHSGAAPPPPPAQPELLARLPKQQSAPESSGPLGLATNLVGEVPIIQLAAEGSGPFDAVPEAGQSYSGVWDTGEAPVNGTVVADHIVAPQDKRRDGFIPDIESTGGAATTESPNTTDGTDTANPASLTAEGTERPKPISWRPPSQGGVNPLRSPNASKAEKITDAKTGSTSVGLAEAPSGQDFASSIGRKTGANRARWIWLTVGAAALVGLAAVGSVKLLRSNSSDVAIQVSPVPAGSVNTPAQVPISILTGPVVKVSKVLAADKLEVTGQYTGTVMVLGIVSPSGTSCGAKQSKQYAIDTLNHQTVTLLSDPSQPARDASGRKLAYLALPNNNDYSTQIVGAGMAKYFDGGQPVQKTAQIEGAQSVAQQDKDGLWGPPCNGSFAGSGSSASSASSSGSDSQSDSATSDSGSTSGSTSKTSTKSKSSHH